MNLILRRSQRSDIDEIHKWRYDPPYDIYNMSDDFESYEESVAYFLNPEYAFHTIFDAKSGELVGICSFGADGKVSGGDYGADALDIGMGVKPEWTGRGLGNHFVQAVLTFAEQTFQPKMIRVTIAEFNIRAQRVWQKAGFEEASRFEATNGKRPFIIYTRSTT